jgi:4-amino-4-deoxy-L-arabinose transferase-like glycosyltransferase
MSTPSQKRRTWNPLRSEQEAFEFVIAAIAYFGAIALASALGGLWAGLAVFAVLTTAGVLWFLNKNRRLDPPDPVGSKETPADVHHVLVVANETVAGRKLHEAVRRATEGRRAGVLVVSPALNSPLRHFVSDEDKARQAAQERLNRSLRALGDAGIDAHGEVGDADPLQAIEDALRTFGADEIIISTHPEGRSNWLEKGVVSGAQRRFTVPITHVVVDLEAEAAEPARQ